MGLIHECREVQSTSDVPIGKVGMDGIPCSEPRTKIGSQQKQGDTIFTSVVKDNLIHVPGLSISASRDDPITEALSDYIEGRCKASDSESTYHCYIGSFCKSRTLDIEHPVTARVAHQE